MNKTIIASSIALTLYSSVTRADIAITNMSFDTENYAASGTFTEAGDGVVTGIDLFFFHTWTLTQETGFLDNTDTWTGTGQAGTFDYNSDISSMTNDQVAVGFSFNWNGSSPYASILEIFDCVAGTCTGNGVGWQSTAVPGTVAKFSGTEITTVPLPAPIWLMTSGLIGLVQLARRK